MHKNFEIQTTYTPESIRAVAKMTYDLYLPHVSGRMYLLAFILIAVGVVGIAFMKPIFAITLVLGGYMFLCAEGAARAVAERMLAYYNGKFPTLKFNFRENDIFVVAPKESGSMQYDIFVRLAENKDYFFLFNGDQSAYTIPKTAFTGGEDSEFKTFLENKTDLTFERGATIPKKIIAAHHHAANRKKNPKKR